MTESLGDTWSSFYSEFQSRNARLSSEIASAWKDLHTLTGTVEVAFRAHGTTEIEVGELEAFRALFGESGKQLLSDPLAIYARQRPLLRVLDALRDYRVTVGDLVRRLPATVSVSRRELAEAVGSEARAPWRKRFIGRQDSPETIRLRAIVASHLQRQADRRMALDGALQLTLAKSALHLADPWQTYRRQRLIVLSRSRSGARTLDEERQWWLKQASRHATRATRLVKDYQSWAELASHEVARAVLRGTEESSERRQNQRAERLQASLVYWSRQQRAVRSLLDLELQLLTLGQRANDEAAKTLESLESEHRQLLAEHEAVIKWLEDSQSAQSAASFPPPQAHLLSAYDRAAEWARHLTQLARSVLPRTVESVEPSRALPGWRSSWRQLQPADIFAEAVEQVGRPMAVEGLRESEATHKAIVREIERAREVVTFGFEIGRSEGVEGLHLAKEAIDNALSLLRYQKKHVIDTQPIAEASVVRAEALTFMESHLAFEKGRLGLLAHVTRRSGLRAGAGLLKLGVQGLRMGGRAVWQGLKRAYQWVLWKTGWLAPPETRRKPVNRRAYLGQVLEVQFGSRDLPMLYQRLFRLAPVEDSRFLVGRDAEMLGISNAVSQWNAGRSVSIMVVGARGSGKTSLLNCAVGSSASGARVVRGQFSERITTPIEMDRFLRDFLQVADGVELRQALTEERRIIVIEEFERTFLRTMQGFQAVRHLLDLLDTTSRNTLWVLSANEAAFRYLKAALEMDRYFSHRVNAMSVRQADVTNAILQRHNLSGLRLQFAPPPKTNVRISRARGFFGLEPDPQQLFFDALYGQSQGIFRSAFELWQGCIERVEGGVVHMRQPLDPDYEPLEEELTSQDHFVLHAILQHGSLTPEELAQVLGLTPEKGHSRTERLLDLEILEPEPVCPGLRVRPEAWRFVRDLLHRQNLL